MTTEMVHNWGLAYQGRDSVIYEPCVILNPHRLTLDDGVRVDSFVKLEAGGGLTIGRWTHVASFSHLGVGGGELVIGEAVAICSGARILSGTATAAGKSLSAAAPAHWQVIDRRVTRIGDYACIGTGAIVLPGVTIGARAIIGAGSVVTRDVPPDEVWVGNPARKLRDRPAVDHA